MTKCDDVGDGYEGGWPLRALGEWELLLWEPRCRWRSLGLGGDFYGGTERTVGSWSGMLVPRRPDHDQG